MLMITSSPTLEGFGENEFLTTYAPDATGSKVMLPSRSTLKPVRKTPLTVWGR